MSCAFGQVVSERARGRFVFGEAREVGARDSDEAGFKVLGVEAQGGDQTNTGEEKNDVDYLSLVLAVLFKKGEDAAKEFGLKDRVGGDVFAE